MSLRDDIQSTLREIPTLLGAGWQYRRLTSGPAAATRTYGAWADVDAHATGLTWSEELNGGNAYLRREMQRIRVSDALAVLHPGDQVRDPDEVVWAVVSLASSGIGTQAYMIQRDLPMKADPGRGAV